MLISDTFLMRCNRSPWPRGGRLPHGAEKMHRPDLELSACIAHGVGSRWSWKDLDLRLFDDTMSEYVFQKLCVFQ